MTHFTIVIPKSYYHFSLSCIFTLIENPQLAQHRHFKCSIYSDSKQLNNINIINNIQPLSHLKNVLKRQDNIIIITDFKNSNIQPEAEIINFCHHINRHQHLILAMGLSSRLFTNQNNGLSFEPSTKTEQPNHHKHSIFKAIKANIPKNQNHFICNKNILMTQRGIAYLQALIYILSHTYDNALTNNLSSALQYSLPDFLLKQQNEIPNKFEETLTWLENNYTLINNINELAQMACMSRRNFDRKFKTRFTDSPKQWLIKKKIALAQNYLTTTQQTLEEVATHSGFENTAQLRQHFIQILGKTPKQFRNQTTL